MFKRKVGKIGKSKTSHNVDNKDNIVVVQFGRRTASGVIAPKQKQFRIASPPPPPLPILRHRIPQHELDQFVEDLVRSKFVPWQSITSTIRDTIMSYPQHFENGQTNPKWKTSRFLQCTGSRSSSLTSQHQYDSFADAMEKCLWNTFEEVMRTTPEVAWRVKWGNTHEPNAAATSLEFLRSKTGCEFMKAFPSTPTIPCTQVVHKEYGLVRSQAFPFAGTSPDGIMELTYCGKDGASCIQRHEIEFKCKTKGYRKNEWPTDEWPQSDLYPMNFVGGKHFPIPIQYYVQIMWCVLIMGKFKLEDMFKIQGHPKHFLKFKEFMMAHLDKAKTQGITTYGEDLVDSEIPIMFVVWAPGNTDTPHQGEPQIYRKTCWDETLQAYRSVMVKCASGCIQITMVDYDHEFAMKTLQHAYYVWRYHWLPRYAMKIKGMLLPNEVDLPMNCFTDEEEEEDVMCSTEEEED